MRKKRVLIIDDEVAFTNIVKLTLDLTPDIEVCVENNPLNAITVARKFNPDIIILDVVMPELDGGEVHSRMQLDPVLSQVPVIFLTAIVRQHEIDEKKGMIGGSLFMAKPVNAHDLLEAINKHVQV